MQPQHPIKFQPAVADKWHHSVWFVLLSLFLLLGPLGLPLLWKSPKFSRWAKVVLTLLMALLIIFFLVGVIRIVQATVHRYDEFELLMR